MKTVKSSSTVKPKEWDTESSTTTVYHNYNIVEKPATEETPKMYEYDQDQLTAQEYIMRQLDQNHADVVYVAMMANIDLEAGV